MRHATKQKEISPRGMRDELIGMLGKHGKQLEMVVVGNNTRLLFYGPGVSSRIGPRYIGLEEIYQRYKTMKIDNNDVTIIKVMR